MLTSLSHNTPVNLDRGILFSVAALGLLGWIMVGSASIAVAENNMGQPFFYFIRQGIFLLMGIGVIAATLMVRIVVWEKFAVWLFILGLLLLLSLMIPGVGLTVKGSTRWIPLGPFNLQVGEIIKLFSIIYLADYLARHQKVMSHVFFKSVAPLILIAVAAVLLLQQPDMGTVVVVFATAVGMLFVGGARLDAFIGLVFVMILAFAAMIWVAPYRWDRVMSMFDPWADPYGGSYQVTQALMAFGRGELFGVGLGSSIQKLLYLPEAHTDFIFAVIGEELGLVGGVSVMILYGLLVRRALDIGQAAAAQAQYFSAQIAYGIGIWLGLQACINMGVNMGVLPTKGLTLPLISYGGSSLLITCMAIGLLLRVDQETRFPEKIGARGQA
jgi:cell division protein FtsW